ncbi:MAG: Rrf2 family transcriptional regulator, partial [Candidatus Nanoarchaeia archaeon]
MKVPTKTRYALRVMLQLGLDYEKSSGKEVSMLGDIARRENLSEKYLSLVVMPLRAHGLINSVRGSKGG